MLSYFPLHISFLFSMIDTYDQHSCSLIGKNSTTQSCNTIFFLLFFREWWWRQEGRQEEGFFFPDCISSFQSKYMYRSNCLSLFFSPFSFSSLKILTPHSKSNKAILLYLLMSFFVSKTSSKLFIKKLASNQLRPGGRYTSILSFYECWKKYLGQATVSFTC